MQWIKKLLNNLQKKIPTILTIKNQCNADNQYREK